jgi:threonine/homoserine/homoserine lactone efflux protein
MALVMSASMTRGVTNGLCVAAGLALSRTLHVLLAALGLAALLAAHPLLFDVVRWVGAAYLLWLAWKILSAATQPDGVAGARAGVVAGAGWRAVRQGVLTNLLNPKALMFCALLLPQFVGNAGGSVLAQYGVLGAVLVALGAVFDVCYALAAGRLARRVAHGRLAQRCRKAVFAGVFAAAALRLVMAGQAA